MQWSSRAKDTQDRSPVAKTLEVAVWPLAAIVVIAHIAWRDDHFSVAAATCCGLLGALALVSLVRARVREVPMLPYVLIQWYLAMGMSAFVPVILFGPGHRRLRVTSDGVDRAALGVLVFAVIFMCVYLVFLPIVSKRAEPFFRRWFDTRDYGIEETIVARSVAGFGLIVNAIVAAKSGGVGLPFGPFTLMFVIASHPAVVLGFLMYDDVRRPSPLSRTLFWASSVLLAVLNLLTGMLGAVMGAAVTALMLVWMYRGRVPWGLALAAIVAIAAMNSAKHSFREMTWRDGAYVSLGQRAENWGVALSQTYDGRESDAFNKSADATVSRLRTFNQVAQIFDWVPDRVGFHGADQWLELPMEFVPRFLWPEKTHHIDRWNRQYTLTFGLQNEYTSRTTAVTLPAAGDGYWRLGWLGVGIEAAIFGLLLALYAGATAGNTRGGVIFGLSAYIGQAIDQHVFAGLSGLPQQVIMSLLLLSACQGFSRILRGIRGPSVRGGIVDSQAP